MDPLDIDDVDQDRLLTRSNSWSHAQRPNFLDSNRSTGRPAIANGLSCIYETDDSVVVNQDHDLAVDTLRSRSKSISGGQAASQVKKRRHSYTELIASAILSSPEKRKTLAEIYDWFVVNVPSFKDQRYMHSSLGWKNAVRHNLSVQMCFKRVKRHGMEKPSWWTVDLAEVSKRRLVLRPTISTSGNGNGDIDDGPFLPPRRNTYSGPHSTSTTTPMTESSDVHKNSCRVASANDMGSTPNLQFLNSNARRTHYAPIRPAVSGHAPPDNVKFTLGTNGYITPGHNEMAGMSLNEQSMDDNMFAKPYAVDTPPAMCANHNSHPALVPSVTLVCKEPPTSSQPYRQAQLEVSFQANDDTGSIGSSTSSPSIYNWSPTTNTSCSQASSLPDGQSGLAFGHFGTWPVISESSASRPNCVPNQTLRVKTVWGNVEDINFNGLLPMRTVVKCDGATQTDEATEKANLMNKQFHGQQWSQISPNRCEQSYVRHSALAADLPEDLAGLQIEGDLQCDIDEVLSASLGPAANKAAWDWSWNHQPFEHRIDNSSFNSANMDMSEL